MDGGLEGVGDNHRSGLVDRAKAIILSPRDEWPKIAAEPETAQEVFTHYAMPLAAIGPVASLLGGQIFGHGAFGITYRPGIVQALTDAVINYVGILIGLFVLALVMDFVAPRVGGQVHRGNAMKLAAYGATAAWLAGIFGLIPALFIFGFLGLYSFYIFWTGICPMMKVPEDKAPTFAVITLLSALVLAAIAMIGLNAVRDLVAFGPTGASTVEGGEVTLPGGKTIDTGEIEKFGKQMEGIASGKVTPVQASRLQEFLPTGVGSYQRTAVETVGVGQMGSTAEATYTAGDKSFRLKVIDMSALGALAGMGAAMGVEQSREDADSYERTGTVGGQMRSESWNKTNSRGKYAVVVANRFMVEAEGQANSVDELKEAVASIDHGDLEDLAN